MEMEQGLGARAPVAGEARDVVIPTEVTPKGQATAVVKALAVAWAALTKALAEAVPARAPAEDSHRTDRRPYHKFSRTD